MIFDTSGLVNIQVHRVIRRHCCPDQVVAHLQNQVTFLAEKQIHPVKSLLLQLRLELGHPRILLFHLFSSHLLISNRCARSAGHTSLFVRRFLLYFRINVLYDEHVYEHFTMD